jgi:hypothetical protein
MSTLEDLDDLEREERKKPDQGDGDGKKPDGDGDAEMKDAEKKEEEEQLLDEEILNSSTADIVKRRRMLENELRIMKSEFQRLTHEQSTMREKVKDNQEKIENNRYDFIFVRTGVWSCSPQRTSLAVAMNTYPSRDVAALLRYPLHVLTVIPSTGNYHISSETLSNSWIWMLRLRPPKKEPTSTWTLPGSASRPSSKRLPVRLSTSRSSV